MRTNVIIFIMLILFSTSIYAQNQFDGLRYSQQFYGGTARSAAMGNSFGALGGDLSVINTNPAGIAIYQRSELSITPVLNFNQVKSDFSGTSLTDNKYSFNINNIGFVGTFKDDEGISGWKNVNFGITYSRTNDFNQNILIEGVNNQGSLLDVFARNLTKSNISKDALYKDFDDGNYDYLPEYMMYTNYLLNDATVDSKNTYTPIYNGTYGEKQRKSLQSTGAMNEVNFAFGANYSHLLYLGGTFSIQNVKQTQNSIYKETNTNSAVNLDYFDYRETISTNGSGVNFKFGAIFRPLDIVRIGVAMHTPTFLTLHDEWSSSIKTHFFKPIDGYDYYEGPTDANGNVVKKTFTSDYQITTPLRTIGSVGFIIQKFAAISLEYEFVDYSTVRMASKEAEGYDYSVENQLITDQFQGVSNFRAGAEFSLGQVKLRGGYAYYGNPYKSSNRINASRSIISGGIGLTTDIFYMDFAYSQSLSKETYFLYDGIVSEPVPTLNNSIGQFVMTFGIKF